MNLDNLNYEVFAAVLIIVSVVLLSAEYLWLYLFSKKSEESLFNKSEINRKVHSLLETSLNSPTKSGRDNELNELFKYVDGNFERLDETANQLFQLQMRFETLSDEKKDIVNAIMQKINPQTFYLEKLKNGNKYEKGYCCRRLSEFKMKDCIDEIRPYVDDKNLSLSYNATMALSELGDIESVERYFEKCKKNYKISHRILLEILHNFNGNRLKLAKNIFSDFADNDYILATALKAFSKDCFYELSDFYIEKMNSSNSQVKIAAVKAIAEFGDSEFTHTLIIALNDKNWVVRASAIKGLKIINNEEALHAVVGAIQDEEWWVRKAAAEAVAEMDYSLVYVEKILNGYDKYAADAVKNALFKTIHISKGGLKK